MDKIPQEVLLCIFEHIRPRMPRTWRKPGLSQCAAVSRRWQLTVEKLLFKVFYLEDADIPTFASLFRPSQAHRMSLVKTIDLYVSLPDYDGNNYHQHRESNNRVYSNAILQLFQALKLFDDDERVRSGDGLSLFLQRVSAPRDDFDKDRPLEEIKGTLIRLKDPDKLPTLSCVSQLFCYTGVDSRTVDPAPMIHLANKLGNLKRMQIGYDMDELYVSAEDHKAMRHGLSKALPAYNRSINSLEVSTNMLGFHNEAMAQPNHVPSSSPMDPFNLEMHKLIQRANISDVLFMYQYIISPEFLWPFDTHLPPASPFWPKLKTMKLGVSKVTPHGDWYFTSDPTIAPHSEFLPRPGDDEWYWTKRYWNTFRSVPNSGKMNPLLIAMARAVQYAPSLKTLDLLFDWDWMEPSCLKREVEGKIIHQFNLYYAAPYEGRHFRELGIIKKRLICETLDWRLDEEVEKYWREALGPDGVIIYV